MKSKPDNNKTDQEYVFDYDAHVTTQLHAGRTAQKEAGWFLPHLKPGMTLLDCGCGQGTISVGLAKAVEPGRVTGIDVSDIVIQRARDRAAEMKITNLSFDVGNICQLDFSDNSIDAIFSHNVLEHIPEPSEALQEMHRVLKPGGVIGIRDVDWDGALFAPDDGIFERNVAAYLQYWEEVGGNPRIGRHLGRLFYGVGFVDVKMSASYDVYSEPESRNLIAQAYIGNASNEEWRKWSGKSRQTNEKELEDFISAMSTWKKLPGAFHAIAHCEAIGWKA